MTGIGSKALVAAGVALAVHLGGGALAQDKLKIGAVIALSGGGVASGISYKTGMEMAARDINAAGGVGGRQIELVFADDQTDTTMAVGEAKRLIFQEKITLLVGPILSGQAIAIAPVVVEGNAINLTSGGSAKITPKETPNTFSLFSNAEIQGKAFADYLVKQKVKAVAIISDPGQNSHDTIDQIKAHLPATVQITGVQEHQVAAADMTPQLLSLRRGNPDMLVVSGVSGADFGRIMKGLEDIGWKVPVAGSAVVSFLYREALNTVGPGPLQGVVAQTFNTLSYCPNDPPGSSNFAKFLARIDPEAKKRVTPLNVASAYDAVHLYKAAVEASGGRTDGPTIAKWIEQNAKNIKNTVVGPYSPSAETHFLFGPDVLGMAKDFDKPREDGLIARVGC